MAKNGNFYHSNNFFYMIIGAIVIALFIKAVGCQLIDKLQN